MEAKSLSATKKIATVKCVLQLRIDIEREPCSFKYSGELSQGAFETLIKHLVCVQTLLKSMCAHLCASVYTPIYII